MSRSVRIARSVKGRFALARTAAALGLAGSLLLSGCAAGMISQTADQVAVIDGGNATVGPIGVRDVLVAQPKGSVYEPGATAELLLHISNASVTDSDTLISITSPAARSVALSAKVALPAQTLVTIGGDGSAATATLTGLTQALCYGRSVPLTFTFEKAGVLNVNASIEIPAERTGTRETIEILPPHPTPIWETGAEHGPESSAAATSGSAESNPCNASGADESAAPVTK